MEHAPGASGVRRWLSGLAPAGRFVVKSASYHFARLQAVVRRIGLYVTDEVSREANRPWVHQGLVSETGRNLYLKLISASMSLPPRPSGAL